MHHQLSESQWIAIAAHRMHGRWPRMSPVQLDAAASELWKDERLRALEPAAAVDHWLTPIGTPGQVRPS